MRTQKFFDEFKHDYYLSIYFLKKVMFEVVNMRNDVTATEEDITRLLSILDTDEDGQINLREFFQLLILFLSHSKNLEKRINGNILFLYTLTQFLLNFVIIKGILEEQSYSHDYEGFLNKAEANEFSSFLYNFYGLQNSFNEDHVIKIFESFKEKDQTNVKKLRDKVTYSHYSREISGNLKDFCFVKLV